MCVCLHGEATPKVVRRMGGRGGDARVSHSLAHTEWAGRGWVGETGGGGDGKERKGGGDGGREGMGNGLERMGGGK